MVKPCKTGVIIVYLSVKMERETNDSPRSPGNAPEPWKTPNVTEAGSGRDNASKKIKPLPLKGAVATEAEPVKQTSTVEAWQRLVKDDEAARNEETMDDPTDQAMDFPLSKDALPPVSAPPLEKWTHDEGDGSVWPTESNVALPAVEVAKPTIAEADTVEDREPADWLKPETTSRAANRLSSERMASTPLADLLALPAAVAASRILAEKYPRATAAETPIDDNRLIELARTIKVDGIPLHQIYESRQIDKAGLHAVVSAHLRGENVEKQLTREIVEKQKSFERDPYIRRRSGSMNNLRSAVGQVSGALMATGSGLAQRSQRLASKVGRTVVSATRRGSGGSSSGPASVSVGSSGNKWLSIVAIVIIYGLILLLWFTRPR